MPRRVDLDKWFEKGLNRTSQKQVDWVCVYLQKNLASPSRYVNPIHSYNREELIRILNKIHSDGENELLSAMKQAWSREKYRSKNKSISVVMSKQTDARLRQLANHANTSLKVTLENVINGNYQEVRQRIVEEKKQAKLAKSLPDFSFGISAMERKRYTDEISKYKEELAVMEEIRQAQLVRIYEHNEIFNKLIAEHNLDIDISDISLNEKEKERALKNAKVTSR